MIILTYITPAYIHWFNHLYLNLQLLSLDRYFHVCTSENMNLPILNVTVLSSNFSKNAQTFGSKEYGKIVNVRYNCIIKFYKLHDILFLDSDVTLFRSPLMYLTKSKIPLFLEDSGPFRRKGTLNSGCIYLPKTRHSINFVDTFVQHLRQENSRNDQDVLNKYKPSMYGLLPKHKFTNGYHFYENRHNHPVSENLVLVHHNWISGDSKKWNRANSFDCIS